jgi:hypothetical protein
LEVRGEAVEGIRGFLEVQAGIFEGWKSPKNDIDTGHSFEEPRTQQPSL